MNKSFATSVLDPVPHIPATNQVSSMSTLEIGTKPNTWLRWTQLRQRSADLKVQILSGLNTRVVQLGLTTGLFPGPKLGVPNLPSPKAIRVSPDDRCPTASFPPRR